MRFLKQIDRGERSNVALGGDGEGESNETISKATRDGNGADLFQPVPDSIKKILRHSHPKLMMGWNSKSYPRLQINLLNPSRPV